jgi:hypothetical protein
MNEIRARNEVVLESLTGTPEMVKSAQDTVTEFTRLKMREDGFWRKILPPINVSNDDLDRQVDTDLPVIVVDMEVDSPAAASIPYGTLPFNEYISGHRYRVMFDRIVTPRFTKDVDELRTYHMDIRQVLSDNAIKDMLAEEDGKAIAVIDSLLVGQDVVLPLTGVAQWQTIEGGVTRDNFAESLKVLPSTPMHLEAATVLINNITAKDFMKWGRDEVGGDLAQEILQKGFGERSIMGVRVLVTIKTDLVETNSMYQFAEPTKLGKFFVLEDSTMFIDRRAYMLEFFAYEQIGSCVANVAAIGRVDFVETAP